MDTIKRITGLKRTICLLLVCVLAVSLCACGDEGGSSSAPGEQNEEVESSAAAVPVLDGDGSDGTAKYTNITMDNWQDYFEFTTEYQFGNGVENMDKYMFCETVFNVRDEWRDQIFQVELYYTVDYTEYSLPGSIDWENYTVTIDEDAEKAYSTHVDQKGFTVKFKAEFDSVTGLIKRTNENLMENDREDDNGTVLFWEPEMNVISGTIYWLD